MELAGISLLTAAIGILSDAAEKYTFSKCMLAVTILLMFGAYGKVVGL